MHCVSLSDQEENGFGKLLQSATLLNAVASLDPTSLICSTDALLKASLRNLSPASSESWKNSEPPWSMSPSSAAAILISDAGAPMHSSHRKNPPWDGLTGVGKPISRSS